jgi:hypothetical protein
MSDPIPRNRSAHRRRSRRLAGQRGWRGAFRRTRDDVADAEPTAPQQCQLAGPALYMDQPLRRTRQAEQPVQRPVPQPDPPPRPTPDTITPAPPQLLAALPEQPPRRSPSDPGQTPPPRPLARPATRRDQALQRPGVNAARPLPPRPPRPRRASTDVAVGVSLLAGVALVVGLVLPLLPSDTPSPAASAPAASDQAGAAAAAPDGHDSKPAGAPVVAQPGAVAGVNRSPAQGRVALLADRSATQPGIPSANQAGVAAQLPAPAGVFVAGQRVEPPAVDQGQPHTGQPGGTGYPDPGHHGGPPIPPAGTPDPQSGAEREALERLARELAKLQQNSGGGTGGGPTSGGGGGNKPSTINGGGSSRTPTTPRGGGASKPDSGPANSTGTGATLNGDRGKGNTTYAGSTRSGTATNGGATTARASNGSGASGGRSGGGRSGGSGGASGASSSGSSSGSSSSGSSGGGR